MTIRISLPVSGLRFQVQVANAEVRRLGAYAQKLADMELRHLREFFGAVAAEEAQSVIHTRFVEETLAGWREVAEATWRGGYGEGTLCPVPAPTDERPWGLRLARVLPLSDRGASRLEGVAMGLVSPGDARYRCDVLPRDGGEESRVSWRNGDDAPPPYDLVEVDPAGITDEEYGQLWTILEMGGWKAHELAEVFPSAFRPVNTPGEVVRLGGEDNGYHTSESYHGILLPGRSFAVIYRWRNENPDGTGLFPDEDRLLGVIPDLQWEPPEGEGLREITPEELEFLRHGLVVHTADLVRAALANYDKEITQ